MDEQHLMVRPIRQAQDGQAHHPECGRGIEQRSGKDRRGDVVDRRLGLDRRRGPGKRRSDERKSAEEGQMSDEQFEFLMAIDEYKRKNKSPFPTWTEVLEVIKTLGYRKVAEPQPLGQPKKKEKQTQTVE